MPSKVRKRVIRLCVIICLLFAVPMGINWFMTYKLEDTLRKRLRQEIVKATDGFYDFSFDKLEVGLFSGELMLKGLTFWPDSSTLIDYKEQEKLPNMYFDVHIDTISFKGINLTWLFDYRKLTFDKFIVNGPNIKVISPKKNNYSPPPDTLAAKSMYEHIHPYFDIIQAQQIDLQRAYVEYIVEDTVTSYYKLEDFKFMAHKFVIDENSQNKEHLLFSDNFEFRTDKPQVIYDSDHFLLNITKIKLSTIDSIVHIGGVHLQPKEKYWRSRFTKAGSYVDTKVQDVILNGISFSRKGAYNFLDARSFSINHPNIESFQVSNNVEVEKEKEEDIQPTMWSLYSIVSPIFEQVSIKDINVESAKFQYSVTKNIETDVYTLNKLDFLAHSFLLDSMSHKYNFFLYVKDFSVEAENITGYVPSKNGSVDVQRLFLSTYDNALKISDAHITPLTTKPNDTYAKGSIKELEITGLNYSEGLDADMIRIISPQVDFYLGEKKKNIKKTRTTKKVGATSVLDVIAPFVSYVSVKDIRIKDGRASLLNSKDKNRYQLDNLDFYAKNFYLDKETRRLRDYFFSWDEYSLRFRDFDNLTPDKRHRVQIKEGDFDSVSGDMLLRDLKVTPEKGIKGSYISISTSYASLLGLDEKAVKDRKISFKTFILDSPVIEVVKDVEIKKATPTVEKEIHTAFLQLISFDLLTIPSPSIYYYDVAKESSLQIQSIQMHVDSFRWELNKKLKIDNLIVESPYISFVEGKENVKQTGSKKNISIASFGDIDVHKVSVNKPIVKVKKPHSYLDFSADNYLLKSLFWSQKTSSILTVEELDFSNPTIYYAKEWTPAKNIEKKEFTRKEVIKAISTYANETKLGRINITNLNAKYAEQKKDGTQSINKLTDTHLLIENLNTNWDKRKLDVEEVAFRTKDINQPLMDNFYTLRIGDIDFSKRKGKLDISSIKLDPSHPKFDFAYKHPKGKDWFKMQIDSIQLSGIDIEKLVFDTILLVKKLKVDYVLLENLKNQKIDIEHNIMPLLYEEFQHLPLKYRIDDVDIRDFSVIYEELAKKGHTPSRIPFTNMNGRIKNFTNIQKDDNSFYTLHVDGLAMGAAPFTAQWKIPVDSTNDKFYLTAEIRDMDMRDFNQLVRPMAPAYVQRGRIEKLAFHTEATSLGATVDMEFVYDSLYVVLLKNMDGNEKNKMLTYIVNRWGIESDNRGKNIRLPHDSIVRDPYHSNFNYFWQILQPPLIKSVGVTEEKQNLMHNITTIINRVKRFFGGSKKEKKTK